MPTPPSLPGRSNVAARWLDRLTPLGAVASGVALAGALFVLPGWARVLAAAVAVGWAAWLNRPGRRGR